MTPIVIGLGGRLRSGKDAVADHLVAEHGFAKVGMSDALLEHSIILNPYVRVTLREALRLWIRPGFWRVKALVDRLGYVDAKTVADYRSFLQKDGTEGGRDFHGEDIWVKATAKRILGRLHDEGAPGVALTGVRFPNEVALVRKFAGKAVWIERPGLDSATPAAAHASENSVSAADFDLTIRNDGTLDDLRHAADDLMRGLSS